MGNLEVLVFRSAADRRKSYRLQAILMQLDRLVWMRRDTIGEDYEAAGIASFEPHGPAHAGDAVAGADRWPSRERQELLVLGATR